MKTLSDISLSLILLVLLSPVLIVVSVLILTIDNKPIFFIQKRIGLNRREFSIIKFRTIENQAVTRLGRILRATGIDELPQLINILKQDMSFIGPRPLTRQDITRLGWDSPGHDIRWDVKPGITGMGQLTTICDADLTWSMDEFYVKNQSVLLDIRVTVKSLGMIFIGKKPFKKPNTG